MKKPEIQMIRYASEDVIVTSGYDCTPLMQQYKLSYYATIFPQNLENSLTYQLKEHGSETPVTVIQDDGSSETYIGSEALSHFYSDSCYHTYYDSSTGQILFFYCLHVDEHTIR